MCVCVHHAKRTVLEGNAGGKSTLRRFHSHYFQGWADFGSFSSLEPPSVNGGGPESEQRSTSPVAMDTADSTSNRTQAYCT